MVSMPMCDCTWATRQSVDAGTAGREVDCLGFETPQGHLAADQRVDVVVPVIARAMERGEVLPVLEVSCVCHVRALR